MFKYTFIYALRLKLYIFYIFSDVTKLKEILIISTLYTLIHIYILTMVCSKTIPVVEIFKIKNNSLIFSTYGVHLCNIIKNYNINVLFKYVFDKIILYITN